MLDVSVLWKGAELAAAQQACQLLTLTTKSGSQLLLVCGRTEGEKNH